MIKKYGGVFGRNPTFKNVEVEGDLSVAGSLIIGGETITGLDYQGSWDANANSPALSGGSGTVGEFYIVSTAGATDLDGITNWGVGDWALYNGTAWQRVEGGADGNFVNLTSTGTTTLNGTTIPASKTLLTTDDVDDTPVDGATTDPISSNWAHDHADLTTAHGISTFGATLVDDADAATARSTLGLGTAATTDSADYATAAQGSLADSAVQPGDNVSDLTNDAGYITGVAWGDITGTLSSQTDLTIDALLPDQTGQSGNVLSTDGTNAQWSSAGTGTVTSVDTGTGLTGGPITSSGTISLDSSTTTSLGLADSSLQPGDIGSTVQAYNANLVTYATNGNTAYGWGDHASAGYATYPSQAGNSGKYLTTDGSTTSWATVDALPDQTGNSGKYLTTDGSAASWAVLDTDANTTTKGLYEMANTISSNYSITSGNNAISAGPITIDSGVSVTVPTGSTWVIA